ncbi:MAG: methyltransferase domain-containing protein [Planctomycetales bacterium]|nr:methyltransferase domain-containing protein [Planctomycetales bacterium]
MTANQGDDDQAAHQFPDWRQIYYDQPVESMPWYSPALDEDLAAWLDRLRISSGRALDLGTGPGTQAIELARRGFQVTASDLSEEAVRLAAETAAAAGVVVDWRQDDLLATQLTGPFDLIFDRGCFHVLPPERRLDYLQTVANWLAPGGRLLLKCFSRAQPGEQGPHRFTPEQIRELFGKLLTVESVEETMFQGTLDPPPRALFCVMRSRQ